MSPTTGDIVCPLCGTRYSETEGRVCHSGCPLQRSCQLLSCPACGYEVPAPTRMTRLLSRWFGKQAASR